MASNVADDSLTVPWRRLDGSVPRLPGGGWLVRRMQYPLGPVWRVCWPSPHFRASSEVCRRIFTDRCIRGQRRGAECIVHKPFRRTKLILGLVACAIVSNLPARGTGVKYQRRKQPRANRRNSENPLTWIGAIHQSMCRWVKDCCRRAQATVSDFCGVLSCRSISLRTAGIGRLRSRRRPIVCLSGRERRIGQICQLNFADSLSMTINLEQIRPTVPFAFFMKRVFFQRVGCQFISSLMSLQHHRR